MSKEAMKLALEALRNAVFDEHTADETLEAIKALEESLAKQEQGEPVAWLAYRYEGGHKNLEVADEREFTAFKVYTTPQQRTWVGLTDEEIEMIVENKRAAHWEFIRQVEAKLKEKNT